MAKLTRERGAANFIAQVDYSGNKSGVRNDFDSCYPFSGIEEVVDTQGNNWVKIPKFYRIIDNNNGIVTGRQLSEYKVSDDWKLNHLFINNKGSELASVEISKYQMSINNGVAQSKSGVTPARNITLTEARAAVEGLNALNDGYEYFLFNIWSLELIQDLFTVEFAQSSALDVMQGFDTFYQSNLQNTGVSDALSHHSGYVLDSSREVTAIKYRGIENIYGNGLHVIDGIYLNDNSINVDINGIESTSSLPRLAKDGQVHQLGYDYNLDLVLPKTIQTTGSYADMYSISNNNGKRILLYGAQAQNGYGLFSLSDRREDNKEYYATYHIVRRLKN